MKTLSWDTITIKDYLEILDILSNTDDPKEQINNSVQILSYLTGNPEEYYYGLPINDAVQEINKLNFLSDFKLIPGYKPSKKIRIGDKDFRVIVPEEMTYGQFIDYQSYSQNETPSIHLILSIFLIPVDAKRYNDGYDLAEIQALILNHLNFRVAQSMLGFILAKYTTSLVRSLKYLAKKDLKNQVNDLLLLLKISPLSIFTLGSVHSKE